MNIDKHALHQLIEAELNAQLTRAKFAASQAYETATHEENKAENKYDTLGLEAAYLAEGQSKRVQSLEQELSAFQQLEIKHFDNDTDITIGALVHLKSEQEADKYLFISPVSGGSFVSYQSQTIMLITPSSPLGKNLKNKLVDDEFSLNQDHYTIMSVY